MTAHHFPPAVAEWLREQEIRKDERAKIVREIADLAAEYDQGSMHLMISDRGVLNLQAQRRAGLEIGATVALGGAL